MEGNKKVFFISDEKSEVTDKSQFFKSMNGGSGVFQMAEYGATDIHKDEEARQLRTKSPWLDSVEMRMNYILVDKDPQTNYTRLQGPTGEGIKMIIDTRWSKEHNSISGIVMAKPLEIVHNLQINLEDIRIGDRAYYHFNVETIAAGAKLNIYDETGYKYIMANLELCYCITRKTDGKTEVVMLSDFLLVVPEFEPLKKSAGGILIGNTSIPSAVLGLVANPGNAPEQFGKQIEFGDAVYFTKDSDVDLKIEGKSYFRMRHKDILAKSGEDGVIVPVYDGILVKPDLTAETTKSGIIIPDNCRQFQNTGTCIKSATGNVDENRTILFLKTAGVQVDVGGEMHLLMKESEILCQI